MVHSSVGAADDNIVQHIQAILINTRRDMNGKEAQFLDNVLRDTYNALHDPRSVYLDEVAVESQHHHDKPTLAASKASRSMLRSSQPGLDWQFYWRFQIVNILIEGFCRLCWNDPNLVLSVTGKESNLTALHIIQEKARLQNLAPAIVHRQLEENFCNILIQGPFEYFHELEGCIIDFSNAAASKGSIPPILTASDTDHVNHFITQQVETILVNAPGRMEDAEVQTFFDNAWMEAYNEMHDPNEIYIDSVDIDAEEFKRDDERHRSSLRGWHCSSCFRWDFEVIYIKVHGNCRGCRIDDGLFDDVIPPLSLAIQNRALRDGIEPAVVHREFEISLCGKLRDSPFEFFSGLDDCIVNLAAPGSSA